MKIYRCNVCGNVVDLTHEGGGTLVCCGEPMEEMVAKSTNEGLEKHLPVVVIDGNKVNVKVGELPHPMTGAHYIMWIAIKYGNKVVRQYIKSNELPEANFVLENTNNIEVYSYCNIHGLWKRS